MVEKIPHNEQYENDEEYETVKREFVESLNEPAFLYTYSDGQEKPYIPQEKIKEESREVKVYFPDGGDEKIVTLLQETSFEEGVSSIAEQIKQAIDREGFEPTVIEYVITSYEGVVNNIIEDHKDLTDTHLSAFIPFEEVRAALKETLEDGKKS